MIKIGDPAPHFEGTTTQGQRVALSDFRGRFLVLYFFPKAFTPGCTRQALRFRDNYPDIKALGAEIIGVSTDDDKTQCDFADRYSVTFPLIADANKDISHAYGVLPFFLPFDRRITFIIDPNGIIVSLFEHEFQIYKHLDKVLDFLRNAQR
jgi:peroxiredoxin Q/BCP